MLIRRGLSGVLWLVLCGLLSLTVQADTLKVSFINPGKEGERFWDMVTQTMQAAARDLDIELTVRYAQRNRIRMQQLGREVLNQPELPDYLVVVNEEQSAESTVQLADEKGVPVLLLLNDFTGRQRVRMGEPMQKYRHWLGSITPDNYDAGFRMADRIIRAAGGERGKPVHMLAIAGDKVTPASILRNEGMQKRVNGASDVILDRLLYANWNQRDAQVMMERYLQWASRNQIRVQAVWAANDPIAQGAVNAMQKQGYRPGKDIMVAGLNWSPEGIEMVRQGELVLTDGGHFLGGAWSMVVLKDHAEGVDLSRWQGRIRFPMSAIDLSNVERYQNAFGDQNWDRVDFSRFRLNAINGSDYVFDLDALFRALDQ